MCTVTWLRQPGSYVLLCNRDERHTRRPASGPRAGKLRGASFIAPVDGDHGGSWIGANEFGLTLCLLNRYGDPGVSENGEFTSRGLLLTDLLDARDGQQIDERMAMVDLRQYRPFTLLALSARFDATVAEWNGKTLELTVRTENPGMLTSTSLKEPAIAVQRRRQFEKLGAQVTPEILREFHRSHVPERGPYSVCMHREDAATVSLSMVTVNKDAIEFSYTPGSPCLAS